MDAQWIICPVCQLKHRRREEATCPRCASPVEGAPAPAPVAAPEPQARHPVWALRWAGGVMLLNVLLLLVLLVGGAALTDPLSRSMLIVPTFIDFCLGITLLRGSARYRTFVLVRVVLGLLVFGGLSLSRGEVLTAVSQALFCTALLLLLLGEPGRGRGAVALILAGCYLLPSGASLVYAHTGAAELPAPLRRLVAGLLLDAHSIDSDRVQGRTSSYSLRAPGEHWLLRAPDATRRDNPQMDLWLYDPDSSAQLLVLDRNKLRPGVTVADAVSSLVDNTRSNHKDFSPFEFVTHDSPSITLKYARGRFSEGPHTMDIVLFALTTRDGRLYRFIAYGPTERFDSVREEVVAAVKSFQVE